MTLVLSAATAAAPLGLAVAGPVADAVGVSIWFLIAGVAGVVLMGGAYFAPAIRNIETQAQTFTTASPAAGTKDLQTTDASSDRSAPAEVTPD